MRTTPQTPTVEQLISPELLERLRAWLRTKNHQEFEMIRMIKSHPEPYIVLILTFLNREATWGDLYRTTAEQLQQAHRSLTEILNIHKELRQYYALPTPHKPSHRYLGLIIGLIIGLAIGLATLALPSKFRLFE